MRTSFLFVLLSTVIGCEDPDSGTPACVEESSCCKVCEGAAGSQACGDSCIAKDLTCHQDDGCACDAALICARE
jgi:hypothetical protein